MPRTSEIKIVNNAITADKESAASLKVNREHNSKVVTITGNLPIDTPLKKSGYLLMILQAIH
ncbi:hypothetical protein AAHH67_17195 [Niallia circulans]